jgi:inhibitor of cysteine peptidase
MNAKRCGSILLLMAVALALGSAAFATPAVQRPPLEEIVVTTVDDGSEVELSEGQVLVVRLQANPSTGYGWQIVQPGEEDILRQADVEEFLPESDLLGAPGTQILRFEAVRGGDTTLKLDYRRPWDTEAAPEGTFGLRVRAVAPAGGPQRDPTPTVLSETALSSDEGAQQELPPAFNWCDLGGCTPVKDQGLCGSCWAFATAGPLELNIMIKEGVADDLSEQYLVSCNTDSWGCNGGWWAHDYHWWKVPQGEDGAGAVREFAFPYVARDDPCRPPHPHEYQIESWQYVEGEWTVAAVIDIKRAIYEDGPVAAAVCVNSAFQTYASGVFEGPGCSLVNHAVVLVGWDDDQGEGGVWYLRNSWGPRWGEEGYMRIGYGVSNVGFGANYVRHVPSECYSLVTDVSPDGAGTVTVDPPANCEEDRYQPGTEVQLTAAAASGWGFDNWSGAAAGDWPSTIVVVDSHKSATANFKTELCTLWFLLPLGFAVCWGYRRRRHAHD